MRPEMSMWPLELAALQKKIAQESPALRPFIATDALNPGVSILGLANTTGYNPHNWWFRLTGPACAPHT